MSGPGIVPAPPMSVAQRQAVKAANEADGAWFRENPGRSYLIRRPYFAEAPTHPDLLAVVLIKQVRPGARLRQVVYLEHVPPGEPSEGVARLVWDHALADNPDMARLLASAEADILGDGGA